MDSAIMWTSAAIAVLGLMLTPVVFVALGVDLLTPDDPIPADVPIPACEFEDGSGQDLCYWDATIRDNGEGRSFIKVNETFHYQD